MKTWEFFLLVLCVLLVGKCFAMTVTTGHGYYMYNRQVIGYYSLKPGNYPDSDTSYVETSAKPTVAINQTASCKYYQMHNPSINMNCGG